MKRKLEKCKRIIIDKSIVSFVATADKNILDINYFFNPEEKSVIAQVTFGDLAQGPPGYAHGGAIAAVLDETMGITSWINNLKVLTTELKTTYIKAVKLNTLTFAEAKIDKIDNNELIIKSQLTDETGSVVFAKAVATFAVLDHEKWKSIGIDTSRFISKNYLEE
jgi:acyl-coenzyme A thioesterase PaaI-like protein